MNQQQFVWWLQGMLSSGAPVDSTNTTKIKEVLSNVFRDHIDPSYPADKQEALQQAHQGQINAVTDNKGPQQPLDWDQQARC
jgi:hypothetical protein